MMTAIAAVGLLGSISASAGTCGPFGMFEGNDYCVNCPSGNRKVYQCPGGEGGSVIVGAQNPSCNIAYYDPNTCPGAVGAIVVNTDSARSAPAPSSMEAASVPVKVPSAGRAVVSRSGDEVIIRMTSADFDKLMTLKAE
jgi:hypothetical protein